MSRLIYGVGINDVRYTITKATGGVQGMQKKYMTWCRMLERGYSKSLHSRLPTYSGCSVVTEWHTFSAFSSWVDQQDWEDKHLDKDILFVGNKVYSPDRCVFIDQALNKFINDRSTSSPDRLMGANWHKKTGAFNSRCCNPFTGRQESLGYFKTPEKSHEAWLKRKHELACIYADMQTDNRIAMALRVRFTQ